MSIELGTKVLFDTNKIGIIFEVPLNSNVIRVVTEDGTNYDVTMERVDLFFDEDEENNT